jgi:paired small multidrug resistance pump
MNIVPTKEAWAMYLPWHEWSGLIGVALVLFGFFLLQAHKLHGNGLTYQLMNAVGALGVLLSLVFCKFNLPAFLLEGAWLLISIYGIFFNPQQRRRRAYRDADRPDL